MFGPGGPKIKTSTAPTHLDCAILALAICEAFSGFGLLCPDQQTSSVLAPFVAMPFVASSVLLFLVRPEAPLVASDRSYLGTSVAGVLGFGVRMVPKCSNKCLTSSNKKLLGTRSY